MTIPCSCIDGRATDDIFGSPGGDAGIVTRALLALNVAFGTEITEDLVRRALVASSEVLRRPLYFHTDTHAMHHFNPAMPTRHVEACADPQNVGCGYLKLCVSQPASLDPENAETLRAIAAKVVTALCQQMWADRLSVELVNLRGDHREDAVFVSDSLTRRLNPNGHAFVYHPEKEALDSRAVARALCQLLGRAEDVDAVIAEMETLNRRHWEAAIGILAPGIEHQHV